MPLEDASLSKEPDGTFNESYCKWCYADGQFAYTNLEDGKRGISAGTNARLSGNVAAYAGTLENPMRDPLLFFADSLLRHLYALNTFYIGFLRALPENFLAGCV